MRLLFPAIILVLVQPLAASASAESCRLVQAMQRTEAGLAALVAGDAAAPAAGDIARDLSRLRQAAREGGSESNGGSENNGGMAAFSAQALTGFVDPREAVLVAAARGDRAAAAARLQGLDIWASGVRLAGLADRFGCAATTREPAETADTGLAAPAFAATHAAPDRAERPSGAVAPEERVTGGAPARPVDRSAGWPAAPPERLSPRAGLPPPPAQDKGLFLRAFSVFLLTFAASATLINRARLRGLRRAQRFPCNLDVAVIDGTRPRLARMVDASRKGCKLRLSAPPRPGRRLRLRSSVLDVEARVAWATAHYAWVSFRRPLGRRVFARVLEASRAAPPAPGKPGDPPPAPTQAAA